MDNRVDSHICEKCQQKRKAPIGRRRRCLNCEGCRLPNCGRCIECRDMKSFGGRGRLKKACRNRRVDDIEDNTELRRGIPVAHRIYSVGATITAINYAEHIAVEKCLLLDHPQAIKIFTKRLLQAVRGNGTDCYWRDNFTCPTEEEHCQAGEMSAGYFLMCVELMQLFSKNKQDFSKLVYTLGQYYQTRNDYLNLCSEKYMRENKLYCEDITEGKFSFPIIHAIHTSPNSKEIQDILKQRTKDVQLIKRCVSLIEENGSFQYTKKRLDRLLGTCLDEVKKFGGNPMLEKFIAEISVKDR